MPTPPALTDRCPTWCTEHLQEDEQTSHTATIGYAGPIEVFLICWVSADQPDPVTELWIENTEDRSDKMTLPLDGEMLRHLSALISEAAQTSGCCL